MCTGRIDPAHVFRAFSNGVDGVFVGGCRLNECNYSTHGNYHAMNLVFLCQKIMEHIGMYPDRLKIEFMSSGEGHLFAQLVNDFVRKVKELGPLGEGEGITKDELNPKLQAISKLVPYIKLVLNEKLRVNFEQVEEYEKFYSSEEFADLFQELIANKIPMFLNAGVGDNSELLRSGSRRED